MVFVNAVTISNTTLATSVSNLSINITGPYYANQVDVNSNNITFYNFSRDNGLETISLTNTEINVNYTGFDIPYFNSSSVLSKLIKSNFSSSNNSVTFSSDCITTGKINYVSANGLSTSFVNGFFIKQYTCSNNLITLTLQVDRGDNYITIAQDSSSLSACSQSVSAFATYIGLIGLLGTVIFLGLILSYLTGIVDKNKFKNYSIISAIVTLIMVAILVIVAIFILSTICTAL